MASMGNIALKSLAFWLVSLLGLFRTAGSGEIQDNKPLVVFVAGDHEYSGEQTLPLLAKELEKRYGLRTLVLKSAPDQNGEKDIPGLEALEKADLAVFFLRWRLLPKEQVEKIRAYLDSGRPVMGFRTSTHAFNYPAGHELKEWNAFGKFALGAPPGWGREGHTHYGHNSSTDVSVIPEAAKHPTLTGVDKAFHVRSWLYHVLPNYPPPDATRLLSGHAVEPDKPAIDNPVAWTWKTKAGGRVFTTTMGHPEDFGVEAFQRLVVNGIHWALGLPVPKAWAGRMPIDVPYRGMVKSAGN
jgi:type 1 glutamine amidotransferase